MMSFTRFATSACGAMGRKPGKSSLSLFSSRSAAPQDKFAVFSTAAKLEPASLPPLPVPPLQITLQKYLRTVRPLLSDADYARTEQVVQDFGGRGKLGEKLQFLLEEKAFNSPNWLAEWWLNTAYLDYRLPVVVYSSPGLVFPLQDFTSKDDQLRYAAKLICGALDYKRMIDENTIPLEMMGNKPLDMSQYLKVMSTCRIPGISRDSVVHYGLQSNPPKHITVAHNNHFYKVTVYSENGETLNENQVLQQLTEIVAESAESSKPVGILSSENRNIWGKVYSKLMKDKTNRYSIEEIQRSAFLVCIDKPNPDTKESKKNVAGMQMIHGCGSKANSGNRWYDKTIQFVIGAKGEVGLTYEHSPAEGPPIANLMDHIVDYISKSGRHGREMASNTPKPERLVFSISNEIDADIKTAERDLDKLVSDLEMSCDTVKMYGKNFIKTKKMSPDSYFQMAIQLAFYRVHGEPGACYESASTRQFIHGRTETIRSTSIESLAFCKAMQTSTSDANKVQALKEAVDSHKKYAVEAVSGFGVDRHLLGLKLIAIENGLDLPQFYVDKGYMASSQFRISTSQVASKHEAFMCYGPLVPNGYSCCYNPRGNEITFGIGALNSCPETSAKKFHDALAQSLVDMHDVLVRSQGSKL